MKKLVRLMSMLLLVAILMSTMAVCAFADEFVIVGGDKPASAEASYDQDDEAEEPEEAEAVEDGDEDAEAESEEEEEEPAEEEELAPAPRELPEGYTDFAAMDGIADLYGEIYCAYYNLILNDVDNLTEGDIAAFKMLFGMTPADAVSYGAGAMSADTPDPTISNENADGLFVVNYVYYNSFLDAINAAKKTGYSVYVREPMVFTDTTDSLSIDLQGVTVRFYCNPAIACTRGTLVLYNGTIITDPRTAEVKYHGDDNAAIYASGEDAVIYLNNVTVKTADVEYTDDDKDGTALVASAGPAIIAANGAQVVVNSGSKIYTCDSGGDCAAIEVESGATVTVYGQVKST